MGGLEIIQGLILVAAEAQATPDPAAARAVGSVVGVMSTLGGAVVGAFASVLAHQASRKRLGGLGAGILAGAAAGAIVGILLGGALHDVGAARGVLIGMAGGALGGLLSGVLSTTGEAAT